MEQIIGEELEFIHEIQLIKSYNDLIDLVF